MALEDIFRALEEQAELECTEILDSAREQGEVIAAEASAEADEIRRRKVEAVERVTRAHATQNLNAARLDAKKAIAAVKDRALTDVYARAAAKLGDVRKSGAYAKLFESMAREALEGISGPVDVLVDPSDRELADKTFKALGVAATVKPDIVTSGGVVLIAADGTLYRRNTFEDRLAKVRHYSGSKVAEILFA